MLFWVDVESSTGVKYGDGALSTISYWKSTSVLDGVGRFEFEISASDPRSNIIKPKRVVRCYTRVLNSISEIGSGIVDKITPTISSTGETIIKVEGDSLLRELTYRSVGFLNLTDGLGNGVNNAVSQIMSFAPDNWSIDKSIGSGETLTNVYGSFSGENILNALVKVAENKGEHFRYGGNRQIVWLGNDLLSSGIRAVEDGDPISIEGNDAICIVDSLEELTDTYSIASRIYPFGSGVGDSQLTLYSTTRTVPAGYILDKQNNCLISTQTESEFGRIDKYLSFKEISPVSNSDLDLTNAANSLYDQSFVWLQKHSKAEQFYKIKVLKLNKIIYPGQTIRVVFKRVIDGNTTFSIDRDLYILETTNEIDTSGIRTSELTVATVSRWNESDATALVKELEQASIYQTYPQLCANSYTMTYREYMDSSKPANLDFWLGREVVNVNQVCLRFKIEPLKSTVKTVAGNSTTSSSGGGGGGTSGGGGGQSTTSGASLGSHYHSVSGAFYSGYTYYTDSRSQSHTHNISIGDHSHSFSIGSHSHNVTPSISVKYGVYEESSSNTLTEADLVYKVNNSDAIGRAVSLNNGWYELDITGICCTQGNYRPIQEANKITISSSVDKTATITGQLLVRTTIQAIATI